MRNPLRWSSTFPAVILSLAGVIGVVAGVVSIRGSLTTTGSVTAAGSLNVAPSTSATGFDAGPMDGASAPVPVVTAGSVSVLESAWDTDDATARTIGWRLKTEGAAGDSSATPATKLLVQSTGDGSTWTTRATIDMAGLLAVTGAITSAGPISSYGDVKVYAGVGGSNTATIDEATGDIVTTGDLRGTGGYWFSGFAVINGNGQSTTKNGGVECFPTGGYVRAVSGQVTAGDITAGSLTCGFMSNGGTPDGTYTITLDGDNYYVAETRSIARGDAPVQPGECRAMYCTGSADLAPASVNVRIGIIGELGL